MKYSFSPATVHHGTSGKKIAGNEYQVSFENAFTFHPDLLVNTTQRLLDKDPLVSDYVVNVVNCADNRVAYGYAVSKNRKGDIVAIVFDHLLCKKDTA